MSESMHSAGSAAYLDEPTWAEPSSPWREEPRGLGTFLVEFAQENPASAALWCFGIGFVLGWRLKPW
ncbi:MAG TPA: hypothetical protein VN699_02095 [Pirellulales bacterium]|nr:hypothetical protein [Pirellulales bacterium]